MGFIGILVYFAAAFSLVFANQGFDREQQNAVDMRSVTQFAERSGVTQRSEANTILSSRQKKRPNDNTDSLNLKLAAFNVRTFGSKKMATPGVPDILVRVGIL